MARRDSNQHGLYRGRNGDVNAGMQAEQHSSTIIRPQDLADTQTYYTQYNLHVA